MLRLAGSRLPWKSLKASTCAAMTGSALADWNWTDTWSESDRAPAMVTALAGAAPEVASGAAKAAPSATTARPADRNRLRDVVRIWVTHHFVVRELSAAPTQMDTEDR